MPRQFIWISLSHIMHSFSCTCSTNCSTYVLRMSSVPLSCPHHLKVITWLRCHFCLDQQSGWSLPAGGGHLAGVCCWVGRDGVWQVQECCSPPHQGLHKALQVPGCKYSIVYLVHGSNGRCVLAYVAVVGVVSSMLLKFTYATYTTY